MENTPDENKLPDLVVNQEPSETLNAVTNNQTIAIPDLVVNQEPSETLNAITNDQMTTLPNVNTTGQSDGEFKGVTNTLTSEPKHPCYSRKYGTARQKQSPLLLQKIWKSTQDNTNDTNETNTPAPVGHDTATTDEEEAVEALLALSNLPDMDD